MKRTTLLMAAAALFLGGGAAQANGEVKTIKQENATIKVANKLMTPEALWAMGRIGGAAASPNGKKHCLPSGLLQCATQQKSTNALCYRCEG